MLKSNKRRIQYVDDGIDCKKMKTMMIIGGDWYVHDFMTTCLPNLRCLTRSEERDLVLYFDCLKKGVRADTDLCARIIMIVDTLVTLKLDNDLINDLRFEFPMESPNLVWKTYFKAFQAQLTVSEKDRKFEHSHIEFLVNILSDQFHDEFVTSDKTKKYGVYGNKTFWSEITFQYNKTFPQKPRSVTAIRNKVKGLFKYPPKTFVNILDQLQNDKQNKYTNTYEPLSFELDFLDDTFSLPTDYSDEYYDDDFNLLLL